MYTLRLTCVPKPACCCMDGDGPYSFKWTHIAKHAHHGPTQYTVTVLLSSFGVLV